MIVVPVEIRYYSQASIFFPLTTNFLFSVHKHLLSAQNVPFLFRGGAVPPLGHAGLLAVSPAGGS